MNETLRTWGLRLLALGLAIGIWFSASVEDRLVSSERQVEASVSYNRPRGFIILDQVQDVNVRLIGSKRAIRQLNPYQVSVQVDLPQREEGTVTINLSAENVLVPPGLEVVSIEPNTIRVELEREVTQRVPVVPQLVGRPADGFVVEEPEVFPNQVLVSGPASLVARTESLTTKPINLNGRTTTFEETVNVVTTDPLLQIVQPTRVSVRVPMKPPQVAGDSDETRKEES
ncbi:MAG: YbbR-like domain-containing protein [Thermoanaerobaculia bacterium]